MPDAPKTRQSLLVQLGRQSDDAWTKFLEVYESAIVRYCRSLGLQDADARDATQEVLAAVHRKLPHWDHAAGGSFRAWLFRVARNIAIDAITARAQRAAETLDGLAEARQAHETALDLEYRRTLFEWAAAQVQSEVLQTTWQAFHETAVQGRTAEATAGELGVSVGSVYTAKCRVMARIRSKVAAWSDADVDPTREPKT